MVEITNEMIMAKRIAELSDSIKKMSCGYGNCKDCIMSLNSNGSGCMRSMIHSWRNIREREINAIPKLPKHIRKSGNYDLAATSEPEKTRFDMISEILTSELPESPEPPETRTEQHGYLLRYMDEWKEIQESKRCSMG